jgi:hypothetical protein
MSKALLNERTLETKLVEDIKGMQELRGRDVKVRINPSGLLVDVDVSFPSFRKKPKEHFFERQKELLPGMALDFNEKTAAASVIVRYRVGVSLDSKGSYGISGATFPLTSSSAAEVERREDFAAEFGKTAIKQIGWVVQKAFDEIEKNPSSGKSKLFLSHMANELRFYANRVRGKEIMQDYVQKFKAAEELDLMEPVIDASKKRLHVQLLDKIDDPQMPFHFMRNHAWGDIAVEYSVRIAQKEDQSFTPPKRELSDATLRMQETQAVNLAKDVIAKIDRLVQDYFKAVDKAG